MIIHDVRQGSVEWDRLRAGIPTSSNFHRIMTPKAMKLSSQAPGLMHWLLAEWLIGEPLESPETQWMQRGAALEGPSRARLLLRAELRSVARRLRHDRRRSDRMFAGSSDTQDRAIRGMRIRAGIRTRNGSSVSCLDRSRRPGNQVPVAASSRWKHALALD